MAGGYTWEDLLRDKLQQYGGTEGALRQMRQWIADKASGVVQDIKESGGKTKFSPLDFLQNAQDVKQRFATAAAAQTLGTPGDFERMLGVQLPAAIQGYKSTPDTPQDVSPDSAPLMKWLASHPKLLGALQAATSTKEPNIFPTGDTMRQAFGVGEGMPETLGRFAALPPKLTASLAADALHAATPALTTAARDIGEGYATTMRALPEPSYTGPLPGGNSQRGAIKLPGGNWDEPSIDQYINQTQEEAGVAPGTKIGHAVSEWLNKQGRRYIKNQFGTPTDPMATAYKDMPNLYGELSEPGNQRFVPEGYHTLDDMHDVADRYGGWGGAGEMEGLPGRVSAYYFKNKELTGDPYLGPWNEMEFNSIRPTTVQQQLVDMAGRHSISGNFLFEPETAVRAQRLLRNNVNDELSGNPTDAKNLEWMLKADPYTPVYRMNADKTPLNLGSIANWAKSALEAAPGEHNPLFDAESMRELAAQNNLRDDFAQRLAMHDAGLGMTPDQLSRTSFVDAARKADAFKDWLANYVKPEDMQGLASGNVVHKDYGNGMKWMKFQPDKDAELPPGYAVKEDSLGAFHVEDDQGNVVPGTTNNTPQSSLADFVNKNGSLQQGLTAEGDAMGHCVGDYCPDVQSGDTEIYSLWDKNNKPHVTIEVHNPTKAASDDADNVWDDIYNEMYEQNPGVDFGDENVARQARLIFDQRMANRPTPAPVINQIKGKLNEAPVDKYLPYVHDFVRSGKWSNVYDLENTGLQPIQRVIRDPAQRLALIGQGEELPGYVTDEEAQRLQSLLPSTTVPTLDGPIQFRLQNQGQGFDPDAAP